MLVGDATVSHKFLLTNETFIFFDETNDKLKKIIPFCVLNMFHFVIKCSFALKIAFFFVDKTTIFTKLGF